jgi:hypothetical protein
MLPLLLLLKWFTHNNFIAGIIYFKQARNSDVSTVHTLVAMDSHQEFPFKGPE